MKRRKHRYRGYSKRTIVLLIALFCSLFFGLGYSLLATDLDLSGIISVKKYDQTLYGVLEKEAKKGTYARTLSGSISHRDSFTVPATKDIYYLYGEDNTIGTQILDKNNVIFANHCWQMFRTTDVGGVKLIYNGEAVNNQCFNTRTKHVGYKDNSTISMSTSFYYGTDYSYDSNSNTFQLRGTVTTGSINIGDYTCRSTSSSGTCSTLYLVEKNLGNNDYYTITLDANSHYSQFGKIKYHSESDSLAYGGYMYNTIYKNYGLRPTDKYIASNVSVNGSRYFGTGVSFNGSSYTLDNTVYEEWSNFYSSAAGLYMCSSGTSCNAVFYIIGGTNSTMYAIVLKDGHLLDYYDSQLFLGDTYIDNGNGTYTINNPIIVKYSEWGPNPSNYKNLFFCDNAATCSDLKYITSISNTMYSYLNVTNKYKYAHGYTYQNGVYELDSDSTFIWNILEDNSMNGHQYTCLNESGICSTLYYVFYQHSYAGIHYIPLENGKNVETALNEMLYDDNVNTYDSVIKFGADAWYKRNLLAYDDYIDDISFSPCREPNNGSTSFGWFQDSLSIGRGLTFDYYGFLTCPRNTDNFSLSNPKAQLKYPIGLITAQELVMFGNDELRKTGESYWMMTPDGLSFLTEHQRCVTSSGSHSNIVEVKYAYGARWVIALKPGTEYVSGTGSMADPYIVDAEPFTPEQDKVRLTINYWNETRTEKMADSFLKLYDVGDVYNVTSPPILGYTADQARVTGTINADTEIDVIYRIDSYHLTITFKYSGTNQEASPTYSTTLHAGDSYSVPVPELDGYYHIPNYSSISGTMPNRNVSIPVVYIPNSDPIIDTG